MSRHSTYRNYAYLTENDIRDGMQPSEQQEQGIEKKRPKYDFQRIISYLGKDFQEFDFGSYESKKKARGSMTARRQNKAIDKHTNWQTLLILRAMNGAVVDDVSAKSIV